LTKRYVEAGILHAQWREDSPFEEGVKLLAKGALRVAARGLKNSARGS